MAETKKNVVFRIQRYNPENCNTPHMQDFEVPSYRGMTILEGLIYIKEHLDSTLTFRTSCRMGICGSCGMMVNNYPHLACHTQVEEVNSDVINIKPLPNSAIIKDLVPDLSNMFKKHKSIMPYIIREDAQEMEQPTREYAQLPDELQAFEQFAYCVKCGICVAACPTSASDVLFLGPQALAQCYHYSADTRDGGSSERFDMAAGSHGAFRCHLAGACSEACPKGVDPALGIQLLKRMMAGEALGRKKRPPAQVVSPPAENKEKVPYPEFTAKE
jgi:succinate dehydrogenase / fumarate reductase, iron-sulfur subunit